MCAAAEKHLTEDLAFETNNGKETDHQTPLQKRSCSFEDEPRIQHTIALHKEETRNDDDEASILILIFWNDTSCFSGLRIFSMCWIIGEILGRDRV
jgi:hypothetical protein